MFLFLVVYLSGLLELPVLAVSPVLLYNFGHSSLYCILVQAVQRYTLLVHHILEIYIDDVVTHAATEEEFVKRLRLIVERCRKFNIKLSPNKTEPKHKRAFNYGYFLPKACTINHCIC